MKRWAKRGAPRWGRTGRRPPDDAHDLIYKTGLDIHPKLSMQRNSSAGKEQAEKSHAEQIRENYETEDLGAIMARFYEAVSWRNN